MTQEEYNQELHKIQHTYDNLVKRLRNKYVKDNNIVHKGDIITDHFHTIKVLSWYMSDFINDCNLDSEIIYEGIVCNESGEYFEGQYDDIMYQHNIKFINGKKI